jgi:DNA (cytosine-5)-methyltransferase 1
MGQRNGDAGLTFLSVFSGIGGIDLGLEAAGFRSLGCIESDAIARETLRRNRPDWRLIEPHEVGDVSRTLTPKSLGLRQRELSVLAGGPPCQPFSKAAQWSPLARRGMKDARAECMHGFMRLIESFLPRVLLIENVQGFVSGKTSAIRRLKASLSRINRRQTTKYRLQQWILNAADYGVPQRRLRAILFAEREGTELDLGVPPHAVAHVTAWDAIGHLSASEPDPVEDRHWLDLLPTIPEGENYLWHTRRGGGQPLFGYRTRFWSFLLKLAKNQPAWTLPAQPGPFTGPFHWDNRLLNTEEMLRLQSFPSTWKVAGTRREQVRQVGNATPPLLVEVIARVIRKEIFGLPCKREPLLGIPKRNEVAPPPAPVLAVPPKFLKLVKDWPDHPGTGKGPRPIARVRATHGKRRSEARKNRKHDAKARGRTTRSA